MILETIALTNHVKPSYAEQKHIYDASIPEHAFHWILYERCVAGEDDYLRHTATKAILQDTQQHQQQEALSTLYERVAAEWARHLERLNVHQGIQQIIAVTQRFTSPSEREMRESCGWDAEKLASKIIYAHRLGRAQAKQDWPDLVNVLNPDPRATSTFARINQWLDDPSVDVLQQATVCVFQRPNRSRS